MHPRERLCWLSKHFFDLGWMRGTGGGLCLRDGERVLVAPSGKHKDLLSPDDLFVLDTEGRVLEAPKASGQVSACAPLFLAAVRLRDAGCVIHGHPVAAAVATVHAGENLRVSELEMIKGIRGHGFFDELSVPILENTAHEEELEPAFTQCLQRFPDTSAVLVRRHGIYTWGNDWSEAKRHAECFDWILDAVVRLAG